MLRIDWPLTLSEGMSLFALLWTSANRPNDTHSEITANVTLTQTVSALQPTFLTLDTGYRCAAPMIDFLPADILLAVQLMPTLPCLRKSP